MSQSHELQLHISQLKEIRTILNSMKNMSFMEIHKLARYQTASGKAVSSIERVAVDFLNFYPYLPEADSDAARICVVIGSERGFCGDFNDLLLNQIAEAAFSGAILVGNRLASRVNGGIPEIISVLEGAGVAEEIPAILNRLIGAIGSLQKTLSAGTTLTAVYHESDRIVQKPLLPPFSQKKQKTIPYRNPPILNLKPAQFLSELIDQYLFAVLHEIFFISLMAENQKRLQHLDSAVQHLDEKTAKLRRKSQIYRQEEITEEIEVILLSAENL
ncbi:MAG: F0F1 ATP synthase subunit gamma [Gammaproteobacteria bacterium]